MIDIIGQLLLSDLKKVKGFEHAVIAGGMVRDSHLGGEWKDIDVFTPTIPIFTPEKINLTLVDAAAPVRLYGKNMPFQVINYKYHDTIPVQIIKKSWIDKSKSYGDQLIKTFNYGIDQAYWDGQKEESTDLFKQDVKYKQATLCKLDTIYNLPNAMEKYFRLREKYPEIAFSSTILKIDNNYSDKKAEKEFYYYKESLQLPIEQKLPAGEELVAIDRGVNPIAVRRDMLQNLRAERAIAPEERAALLDEIANAVVPDPARRR